MTNSYCEGFSKTASEYGVDPAILIKFSEYCKKAGFLDDAKFLGGLGLKAIKNPTKAVGALRRMAENGKALQGPEGTKLKEIIQNPTVKSIINGAHGVANWWGNLDPNMKRGLGGMALPGLGSMLFTDGNLFQRLIKGLGYGTLGGAAAYGLSRSGLYDKGIDFIGKNWGAATEAPAQPIAQGIDAFTAQREMASPYHSPDYMPWAYDAKTRADQLAASALSPQTTL